MTFFSGGLPLIGLLVALGAGVAQAALTMPRLGDQCRVPLALLTDSDPLPATAAAVAGHRPLVIVTLGSSSTAGFGARAPEDAYPAVLQRELRRALSVRVRVINHGVMGEAIDRTAARIGRDVLAWRPQLVIWQTGTNDLLRGSRAGSLARFHRLLGGGVRRLRQAGIDVLLMDLQYFPRGERSPLMSGYLDAIEQVSETYRVPLIQRHRIMSFWLESGEMTVDDMLYRDRLHMSDRGYRCLGEVVADFITRKCAPAPKKSDRMGPALIQTPKSR